MKKGIIASAAVMVLAFISTVCFGVACGRQGLQALFRENGAFDEWREGLINWRDIELYSDFDDWDDNSRVQMFQSEGAELAESDTLKIDAECGSVRILKSANGDTVKAVLEQYSKRQNAEPQYTLSVSENGELRVVGVPNGDGVTAMLTVYVPNDLQTLSVRLGVGELDIVGITAENMEAELSTGDLEMESCTVGNANLQVHMGNAELKETVVVSEKLNLICDCGNAELKMPETAPFNLEYSVDTGYAEIPHNRPYDVQRTDVQSTTGDKGTVWRAASGDETVAQYTVSVHLGNLELEFGTDFDD